MDGGVKPDCLSGLMLGINTDNGVESFRGGSDVSHVLGNVFCTYI